MDPACIHSGFRVSESLAALSSVCLNTLLVAVVLFCKSADLKAYSLLILWNCAADTLLALASYFAEFHGDVRQGVFVLVNNGFDFGVHPFVPLTVYGFAIYFAISIMAVPMLYRYLTVCRYYVLKRSHVNLIIPTVMILPCAVCFVMWTVWLPAWARTTREMKDAIASYPCHDRMEFYVSSELSILAIPIVVGMLTIALTYSVVVFCALKVHKFIRNSNLGPRKQEIQRQIGWALLTQAVMPLFVSVIPIGALMILVVSGAESLHVVMIAGTSFSAWIPVFNPVCAIYFIKPYRRLVLRGLGKCSALVHVYSADSVRD